jgi:hypothetical protein
MEKEMITFSTFLLTKNFDSFNVSTYRTILPVSYTRQRK